MTDVKAAINSLSITLINNDDENINVTIDGRSLATTSTNLSLLLCVQAVSITAPSDPSVVDEGSSPINYPVELALTDTDDSESDKPHQLPRGTHLNGRLWTTQSDGPIQ